MTERPEDQRQENWPKFKLQGCEVACWATDEPWLVLPAGALSWCLSPPGASSVWPPHLVGWCAADWQSLEHMPWSSRGVGHVREGFQCQDVQCRSSFHQWRWWWGGWIVSFLNLYAKYIHWFRWKTRGSSQNLKPCDHLHQRKWYLKKTSEFNKATEYKVNI